MISYAANAVRRDRPRVEPADMSNTDGVAAAQPDFTAGGFIQRLQLDDVDPGRRDRFPFSIPALGSLRSLTLHPKVTFLVGENGSGKSTLLEAIAQAAGFGQEGGSKNFNLIFIYSIENR